MQKIGTKMKTPDDICEVCMTPRDLHGDKNHKFSEDGVLEPLDPAPPAAKEPPRARGEAKPSSNDLPTPANFVALLDVLIGKGVLNGYEVAYILAGGGDSLGRPSTGSAPKTGD